MKLFYTWDERIGPILYFQIKNKNMGLCLCHRNPERSIKFFGLEKYLCSRCLGIVLGFIMGMILRVLNVNLSPLITILISVPLIVDGFTQSLNFRESNNSLRLITGILFGISIAYIGFYI